MGGDYGQGVIVQNYTVGAKLTVLVQLTANHMGYFYFYLCNLDESPEGRENDECFEKNRLSLTNGKEIYQLETTEVGYFRVELQLPENLRCEHCVLQWTYNAGEYSYMDWKLWQFRDDFFFLNDLIATLIILQEITGAFVTMEPVLSDVDHKRTSVPALTFESHKLMMPYILYTLKIFI